MSANALVWWVGLAALIVVLGLTAAQAVRAVHELNRLRTRVADYAELPVFSALAGVEADVQRLEAALEEIEPLVARAYAALDTIRRGPVPAELVIAAKHLGAEIVALRMFASR